MSIISEIERQVNIVKNTAINEGYNSALNTFQTILTTAITNESNARTLGDQSAATTAKAHDLKLKSLNEADRQHDENLALLTARLDRAEVNVIELQSQSQRQAGDHAGLKANVQALDVNLGQIIQIQQQLNEAKTRIAQLELQNLAKDRAIEEGKREQERWEQRMSDLAAAMQQKFDAFKDTVKAQQNENSILIEQLREKVSEQATRIALRSADDKKTHRLSGEILPGNEPSPRAEKFQLRRERSLRVLPLPERRTRENLASDS